jgi:PAS domain S-box-containing protein
VADYTYDWEYWTEPQQKMLYVSPSCERISGYRPEDFMVESGLIYEVVHPDDRDIFKCHADHYHKLQIDSVGEIVFRIVNRNGETLWIAHLCQPVYSNDGQFLGRRASNRDISDRKRTEETLRETKNYLESLIDHANAPIIVWNPQFQIIRFNHAFEFLTGRTAADVIGKHLEILFPPDLVDSSMERVKNTPLGEHWESVEISILNTGGTVHTVLWNSATIFATDGMTPVATIAQGHDITVRKRMEGEQAKLEAQNRQLQKVESLSRMAGAIAHHFNNNLGAVIGNLEMVIDDLPKK